MPVQSSFTAETSSILWQICCQQYIWFKFLKKQDNMDTGPGTIYLSSLTSFSKRVLDCLPTGSEPLARDIIGIITKTTFSCDKYWPDCAMPISLRPGKRRTDVFSGKRLTWVNGTFSWSGWLPLSSPGFYQLRQELSTFAQPLYFCNILLFHSAAWHSVTTVTTDHNYSTYEYNWKQHTQHTQQAIKTDNKYTQQADTANK